jgi:aspartyl-tRNA(Asn)/glutamyl-tRNA(Gln) amidotransferase subunit A
MADELVRMTVAELSERIAARDLSPVDVVSAYLDRIAAGNPRLHAYVTVAAETARREARALADELTRSGPRGPLHGIPIAIKDLQDTRDLRTTYGSSFFRDHVPAADAASVARLRAAGAIFLGKTNTHEFACGVSTDNPHHGTTRNPWDPGRIPGGSSGGSAAAVAGGLAPLATGTDTGGSIRMPAALCGCVGIKPTHGRVSLRGTYPMASSLDHVGPIGRTARDCAIALNAMAGFDPDDPWSRRFPEEDFTRLLGRPVAGRRIGVDRSFVPMPTEPAVEAGFERALASLRDLGAEIVDVRLPPAGDVLAFGFTLISAETHEVHAERFASSPEGYGSDLRLLLGSGRELDGTTVARALHRREELARGFERVFTSVDALISPTVAIEAPPIGATRVTIRGADFDVTLAMASWTMIHNVSRLPTIAVPSGRAPSGLPTSVQISTAPGEEALALALGDAVEHALWPPRERRPAR